MDLSQQKCRRHAGREAAVRCPSCGYFYCRECVTEHEDRLLCSDCLARLTGKTRTQPHLLRWLLRGSLAFVGFFLLWLSFYQFGRLLLSIPSKFHEGTFWTDTVLDLQQDKP